MIQVVKKTATSALATSLAIFSFAPSVHAQTLWEVQHSIEEKQTNGEIISEALLNTYDENFTATIHSTLHTDGVDVDWSNTETEYTIDINVDELVLEKSNTIFSYSANNQNIDFSINSNNSDYPDFFPFKGTLNWSEEGIIDLEKLQFAFKSNINIFKLDNIHIKNLIAGGFELYELIENKWITLDFPTLHNEFPELTEYITGLQDDLAYEFGINDIESLLNFLSIEIDFAENSGEVSITRIGNIYTLTNIDSTTVLTITLNSNNTIASLSVNIDEEWINEWSEKAFPEYSNTQFYASIDFTYNNPEIVFPVITTEDFDITSFYRMFLEIQQADSIAEQKENQFYKNLSLFTGDANEAIDYLTQYGNKLDAVFVREYITNAKFLDRNIRWSDIQQLLMFTSDEWILEDLYSNLKYDVNAYYKDKKYEDKYTVETFIEIFDIQNISTPENYKYHYIDWDIYTDLNLQIKNRGDILILLAKVRMAESMQ